MVAPPSATLPGSFHYIPVDYCLGEPPGQTLESERTFEIYLAHREGRLPLRDAHFVRVFDKSGQPCGVILRYQSADALREQIGDFATPLPVAVRRAAQNLGVPLLFFAGGRQTNAIVAASLLRLPRKLPITQAV